MAKEHCVIRTPQFRNDKLFCYTIQSGTIDLETLVFTPDYKKVDEQLVKPADIINFGHHVCHFSSYEDYIKHKVK